MATVTGMTAAAMQAIRDDTIVSGAFDTAGHLILTKYDGSTVDAGAVFTATDTQPGTVELATNAEVAAGTDTTRAVTPAGLASIPKVRIATSNQYAETAIPSAYPDGITLQNCTTGSGWSLMNGFGTVTTYKDAIDRTYQTFTSSNGGSSAVVQWTRTYHTSTGGGGWTAWSQNAIGDLGISHIDTAKASTDLPATYPSGMSMMALTSTTMSSGNWTGLTGLFGSSAAGIVHTERPHTGNVTQYFMLSGASSTTPAMAIRTGDSAGWGAWQRVVMSGEYSTAMGKLPPAMAWGTLSITPVANTVTSASITFPAGRFTSAPSMQVTANTTVPGSQVTEVSAGNVTATGCDIFLYRTNTTNTFLWWLAVGS